MKKILLAAITTLCFASNSFAQENAGGAEASNSAFGQVNKETIVAAAVGVGLLGAIVANNRGSAKSTPTPGCDAGETLVDGECVPTPPTTTVTTTTPVITVTSTSF